MSCCMAGHDAWAELERARQAGEQLSAIPWCCRNSAPERLLFAWKHDLLRPESLAGELADAWSMVEVSEAALSRSAWTFFFRMAGYSEDGKSAKRPAGRVIAYRGRR
jgi:hypothetical protein